ncbi:uncharacterized protein LOC132600295 [Lycium barbarum]|uniref:uncharacterized protein LOC132600295 n=1 Tax=Lycium barbarum TaxID=112863 RepID=UPI00293EA4DF|nr:uncharacterized protein LOC132600295 [Lycium barbarum]
MANISSLIRHSGIWNDENKDVNYKIDAVTFKEYSTYEELLQTVATQLNLDKKMKNISIKYMVEGDYIPMEIHNDMGVRVYMELKKENKALPIYTNQTVGSRDFASSSCGKADLLFENNKGMVINDKNQKVVAVDQVYKDKDTLKVVMVNYAITNRFNYRTERSNAISYTLVCVSGECDWKFRASSVGKSGMFRVREFQDKHTCPLKVYSQCQAKSRLISEIVKPKISNHKRKYTPKDIAEDAKNDFGMDVSYMVAWRAKERAMNDLMGEPAESYKRLPGYLYILDKTYPGSHIRMRKTRENEFMYVFIALYAFIKDFDYCRPIVVVDGSHLKTPYNGTFVSSSTLDGAGNILPLAYGVIDSENDRSWTWFFERFRESYGIREICVSYQIGMKAYTQDDFDELMGKVQKVDMRVAEYLESAGRDKWARLYASVNRGWTMTSNITECINRHLLAARELPIYDFLEEVRRMFGRWNYNNRRNGTYAFTTLGKKFQEMLSINEYLCLRMMVEPSTEFVYTVHDGGRRFILNLNSKTCSCRMFQLDEIPCPHAWAVIKKKNLVAEDYCSDLFKPETVLKTYDVPVDPLPD